MTGTEGTGRNASRRAVVAAAGATCLAAALAACGDSGDASQPPKDDTSAPDSGGDGGDGGDGAGAALAAAADIPVGGGKVFPDQKVVVTQPTEGEFRAYASICTHQGAALNEVTGGTINCPLHGSRFAIADGSVKKGPATQPLPGKKVTVDGDSIKLG
ncbi:Rieske (2Fe-2S) protein [Streptomyces sp. NPDC048639]|uniref:Rieske (2Fe-2S) protein n=1 Tax=Streptomyces sp. NPDC048639 TaxID=3365581 RepID=UPI00371A12F9